MLLSVKHERLCYLIIPFLHQSRLHLILYVLHGYVLVHVQMTEYLRQRAQVCLLTHRIKCFDYGIHNFVKGKTVTRTVPFHDSKVLHFYFIS